MTDKQFVIPNLCKNTSVLGVLVATQLWASIVTLLGGSQDFTIRLGAISLYSHWISLSVTLTLCFLKDILNKLDDLKAVLAVAGLCLVVFFVVEFCSQWVLSDALIFAPQWWRAGRLSLVALILILFIIRVFSISSVLEQRSKAEVESRVQALQSRIRPHFLFNSLNTIAELTATEPKKAEDAIDSLALLFRASLETDKRFHSLESELNLCMRYIELEKWRLEDRLELEWQVNISDSKSIQVPKLILQPLVENAIVHGGLDDGSVKVKLDLRETDKDLSIVVENLRNDGEQKRGGHGIAIDNIRERLFVLYDDRQTFRARELPESYSVLLRFPKFRADSKLSDKTPRTKINH